MSDLISFDSKLIDLQTTCKRPCPHFYSLDSLVHAYVPSSFDSPTAIQQNYESFKKNIPSTNYAGRVDWEQGERKGDREHEREGRGNVSMGVASTEWESTDVGRGWVLGLGVWEGAVGDRRDDRRYVKPPPPRASWGGRCTSASE